MNKTFCFKSKRGVLWNVVYWENDGTGTYSGYMWHRKPNERVTGGWKAAKADAYSGITAEAATVAKERYGIELMP